MQTRIVVNDFARVSDCSDIFRQVEDLELSILVNNVGIGSSEEFLREDIAGISELVNVNIFSQIFCTSHFLQKNIS